MDGDKYGSEWDLMIPMSILMGYEWHMSIIGVRFQYGDMPPVNDFQYVHCWWDMFLGYGWKMENVHDGGDYFNGIDGDKYGGI